MTYSQVVQAKGYKPETLEEAFNLGQCAMIAQFIELLGYNSITFDDIRNRLPKLMTMKSLNSKEVQ